VYNTDSSNVDENLLFYKIIFVYNTLHIIEVAKNVLFVIVIWVIIFYLFRNLQQKLRRAGHFIAFVKLVALEPDSYHNIFS
jgi:hypothetical protein